MKRMSFRYLPGLCLLFFILSCSIPTDINDNPLDPEEAILLAFETPALVCFPASQTIPTGPVTIKLFAMGVTDLSGAYIRVKYNKAKLNYTQTISGDFFADAQDPIFFYEHNFVYLILLIVSNQWLLKIHSCNNYFQFLLHHNLFYFYQ